MQRRRVGIVAGGRTPFVASKGAFSGESPLSLGTHAVRGLIERHDVAPGSIDSLVYGAVVPEPDTPNLAREIVFEAGLPPTIDAQTVSSYCVTGLRAITIVADAIAAGRIDCGIAGGVEWLSGADPATFREPSTGRTMGDHTEETRRAWEISRERQDEIALASHRAAIAARDHIRGELLPLAGVQDDGGPRDDTSAEALAALAPAFAEDGTLTAGNSCPISDGASAVVLMSERRIVAEGREPLAWLRAVQFGAIDPAEGLLMAPARVVPRLLERSGLRVDRFDLIEMHEAFAAQVAANVVALETGWKGAPTSTVDWSRVNVNGGSLAIGHPWSATGGRLVTGLAREMERRDVSLGLVVAAAAGAMAGAMVLERG